MFVPGCPLGGISPGGIAPAHIKLQANSVRAFSSYEHVRSQCDSHRRNASHTRSTLPHNRLPQHFLVALQNSTTHIGLGYPRRPHRRARFLHQRTWCAGGSICTTPINLPGGHAPGPFWIKKELRREREQKNGPREPPMQARRSYFARGPALLACSMHSAARTRPQCMASSCRARVPPKTA